MSFGGNNQNNSDIAMTGIRIQGLRIRKSQGGRHCKERNYRRSVFNFVLLAHSVTRPTQSIMYALAGNRYRKNILLILQYKYLKSCSGDFYSQESDPPHKIMRYWFYYSI
jgi:hypothetical protein